MMTLEDLALVVESLAILPRERIMAGSLDALREAFPPTPDAHAEAGVAALYGVPVHVDETLAANEVRMERWHGGAWIPVGTYRLPEGGR
jgi:hypothetical protein